MSCDEIRQLLLAHLEGDPPLSAEDSAALSEHLAGCPDCRAEAESLREQVALLRGAGAWAAERGAALAFSASPPATAGERPRVPPSPPLPLAPYPRRGRRILMASASLAAAVVLAAGAWWGLSPRGERPGRLFGVLADGGVLLDGAFVEDLHSGDDCLVPPGDGAVVRLPDGAALWFSGGSRFHLPVTGAGFAEVDLRAGSVAGCCLAPVGVRSDRLTVRACGRFAMSVPAAEVPVPPDADLAGVSPDGWLFPSAVASESPAPAAAGAPRKPAAFLLLSGWADLRVGEEELHLVGRRAVICGDGGAPALGLPEGLLAASAAEHRELIRGLAAPRYRAMVAEFAARRGGYLLRSQSAEATEAEREELAWRVALLEDLRRAHSKRLAALELAERPREERAALLAARHSRLEKLFEATGLAARRMETPPH